MNPLADDVVLIAELLVGADIFSDSCVIEGIQLGARFDQVFKIREIALCLLGIDGTLFGDMLDNRGKTSCKFAQARLQRLRSYLCAGV